MCLANFKKSSEYGPVQHCAVVEDGEDVIRVFYGFRFSVFHGDIIIVWKSSGLENWVGFIPNEFVVFFVCYSFLLAKSVYHAFMLRRWWTRQNRNVVHLAYDGFIRFIRFAIAPW